MLMKLENYYARSKPTGFHALNWSSEFSVDGATGVPAPTNPYLAFGHATLATISQELFTIYHFDAPTRNYNHLRKDIDLRDVKCS